MASSSSASPPPPYTSTSQASQSSQANHPVYGLLPYAILPPYYTNFFPTDQQANINTNASQASAPATAAQPAMSSTNVSHCAVRNTYKPTLTNPQANNPPSGALPAPITSSARATTGLGISSIPHVMTAPRRLFGPERRRGRDCAADILFSLIIALGAFLLILFIVSIVLALQGKSDHKEATSS